MPLDIEAILRTLDRHGVEYILIGGLAARLHGSPLLTDDVDITPAAQKSNVQRLVAALRELGAELRVAGIDDGLHFDFDEESFHSTTAMTLTTRDGPLDLCFQPAGTGGFPDLTEHAEEYEVFGLTIRVASLDDIIRSKQAAGRDVDLQALPTLQALRERKAG
jgi:hypothetical protein